MGEAVNETTLDNESANEAVNSDLSLSLDFDKAIWEKQPLLIRKLGNSSNYYRFFGGILDILQEHYLDEEDASGVRNERSFTFLARQLFLSSASGDFLDEHGNVFGVSRLPLESDELYSFRILQKLLFSRSSPSFSLIKSYAKAMTSTKIDNDALAKAMTGIKIDDDALNGYDINIYDHRSVGFIMPSDWEAPEQLVMCTSGTLYTHLLIEYKEDSELNEQVLKGVLGDIIPPFVSYDLRAISSETWSSFEYS